MKNIADRFNFKTQLITTFEKNNRKVTVSKDSYHYIIDIYDNNNLIYTKLHSSSKKLNDIEDIAENYLISGVQS